MLQLSDKLKYLVNRIKRGDNESFSMFYDLTYPKMKFYAKCYLKDKQVADDIVNDVYVIFCKNIDDINSDKNIMNWLIKVTINASINYNKKTRDIPQEYIEDFNCDTELLEIEDQILLKDSILDLNEDKRNLFYLYYVEERTVRNIAKILSCSKTKVWNDVKKLNEELRKKLQ